MQLTKDMFFRAQQEAGLAEVLWANERKDDLRQFLAALILLGFNLVLNNFIGSSECDFDLCKKILDENLDKYPDGAFFTFFKARMRFEKEAKNFSPLQLGPSPRMIFCG